ncbi:hypothetical protein [Smaragdicoccus niigatensis]|uniref:hypothetical protein n=1 Tax=Smaragdicoccus niigatensis TaxID=359359 RepID=UPI000375944E|nr:hypothetical protein [Smaragdicoccus niigatensis]
MIRPAVTPPPLDFSYFAYGRTPPATRAAELPGMCSVAVQDLFDDLPDPIYNSGGDPAPVRNAAHESLAGVDMAMIGPDDSVNILCSEHGFALMGGHAYAELLKTIRDEVVQRTGTANIKLALSSASSKFERFEILPKYGLDTYFEGKVISFGPYDTGIEIETEIGVLYGIRAAYNARWLIHVHYDDPREVHYHHVNGRLLKSFTMSYARMETRSIFHTNFPTRSANIVPRAIYESMYIQERFAFAVALKTAPTGVMGVDADNDLIALDHRVCGHILRRFGKMLELFNTVDSCFVVADDTRWLPYQHAGGMTACALYAAGTDHLDLDLPTDGQVHHVSKTSLGGPVKAVVLNYAWKLFFAHNLTIAAGAVVGKDAQRIHANREVIVATDLAEAVRIAAERTGTERGIVFDGSYGAINMTRAMAEYLLAQAPEVSRRVDEELMPKWLRQRNLSPVA